MSDTSALYPVGYSPSPPCVTGGGGGGGGAVGPFYNQDETRAGIALNAAGDLQGWVFNVFEDSSTDTGFGVVSRSLGFLATDGTYTENWAIPAGWTLADSINTASPSTSGIQRIDTAAELLAGVQAAWTPTVPAGMLLGDMSVHVEVGAATLTFPGGAVAPVVLTPSKGWSGSTYEGVPLSPPVLDSADPAALIQVAWNIQIPV